MAHALSIVVAGASIAAVATNPVYFKNLVQALVRATGYNAPGGAWRIAAILLALVNVKNLPFVWHFRIFRAMIYQIYFQPTQIPPHALFQPAITSTHTSLLETDYNMHKSNSTYFSDMDVSRTHLFTAIIRNGIKKNSRLGGNKKSALRGAVGATEGTRGSHIIALGGICCNFKKEIKPYTKFEMWTRLLCWDRKWFYLITHLVKPGSGKPASWTLQPWRKTRAPGKEVSEEELLKSVYATAIAKYVIKRGRITVPPEQALIDADMIPAKPEGWVWQGFGESADGEAHANGVLPKPVDGTEWNWDIIEAERQRGLKIAEHYAALDDMHRFFDGGKNGALGEYPDLLF
ncbi:hypothetical protein E8E13_006856 [Curvularia kusanoi]|uniref:Capsule polysaccharide biosynthesis protein n=1 Tax=Curvularia kusanoi TaxID=90978 RepID=A0A9P4WA97_CURKU|nr:hypothetical protein E8E13_006856 [Curvularia kusanoi]